MGGAARGDGGGVRDPQRPHARWSGVGVGRVLATTVHGLLEDPDVVERLVGRRPPPVLEETFDLLADAVDAYLDTELLRRLIQPPSLSGFSTVSAPPSMLARCEGCRRHVGSGAWSRSAEVGARAAAIPAVAQGPPVATATGSRRRRHRRSERRR